MMQPDSRIYVAGHRGLAGSAILRRLQREGCVHLITRRSDELDLRDQAAVEAFFMAEKPEYVFLAAGKVGGIHANDNQPADFIRDNLQIETNVIDAAYRHGATKLLFLGSSCIYPRLAPQPLQEDSLLSGPLEPTNQWYAIAKIAGIKMCQAYRRQYGFDAISAMPTNLYGPHDHYDLQSSHVLPALMRKFHLAKLAAAGDVGAIVRDEAHFGPIPDDVLSMLGLVRRGKGLERAGAEARVMLWGTGSPRREFLYVDDLADAAVFLMRRYSGEQIVNVGVGEDVTIRDLAEHVRDVVGFAGEIVWDDGKPDGTPRKLMDVDRIHRLGWRAGIGLDEGLRPAYEAYLRELSDPEK